MAIIHHDVCRNCGGSIDSDGDCRDCIHQDGIPCHFCDEPIYEADYDQVQAWPAGAVDVTPVDAHRYCASQPGWDHE